MKMILRQNYTTKKKNRETKKEKSEYYVMNVPADGTGASIHPDNGFVERKTSGFAPDDGGLSLISKTNGLQATVDIVTIGCGFVKSLGNAHFHTLQYLHWIMFHPSSLGPNNIK